MDLDDNTVALDVACLDAALLDVALDLFVDLDAGFNTVLLDIPLKVLSGVTLDALDADLVLVGVIKRSAGVGKVLGFLFGEGEGEDEDEGGVLFGLEFGGTIDIIFLSGIRIFLLSKAHDIHISSPEAIDG